MSDDVTFESQNARGVGWFFIWDNTTASWKFQRRANPDPSLFSNYSIGEAYGINSDGRWFCAGGSANRAQGTTGVYDETQKTPNMNPKVAYSPTDQDLVPINDPPSNFFGVSCVFLDNSTVLAGMSWYGWVHEFRYVGDRLPWNWT